MSGGGRLLGAAVLGLAALLAVESLFLDAAWLPLDEAAVIEAARGGAAFTEPPAGPLLSWLLRPLRGSATADLYGLAQALSLLAWAALAVPAYLLARRTAPLRISLVAAVVATLVPASVFALAAAPDALATLLGAFALLACVRAAEAGSPWLLGVALGLSGLAALARPWLALLPVALGLAYALVRAPVGRLLRWPGSLAFAALAGAVYALWWPLTDASPALERALGEPGAVARGALASLAPLALGLGLLPWLAAWSAARRPLADPAAAVFATAVPALALSAGLAAAARGGPALDERPLLVVAPLVLALAAKAWAARELSPLAVLVGAGVLASAALLVPRAALDGAVREVAAPGLALFAGSGGRGTFLAASLAAVVLAAVALRARARLTRGLLPVAVAVLVVSGQFAAFGDAHGRASSAAAELPGVRDWLDRLVPEGERVAVVTDGRAVPEALLAQTAIWNRSLGPEREVDPAAADPATGLLPGVPAAAFALARGLELAGEPLARTAVGELVRARAPLGLAATVEGVYGDGWSGAEAVYRRFSGGPGTLRVTVARTGWGGADVPGSVVVAVDGKPQAQTVIHAGGKRTVEVRVPAAPFRVAVTTEPTFSPADFGQGDARELGAQLGFDFRPE